MPGIRTIYRKIKGLRFAPRLHTVRRIDRVFPPSGRRVVSITFDDGPCRGPARPSQEPVTSMILDTLKQFGAKGTFDVIGSTEFKYPDQKGANGGPYWNGIQYDHYPEFGADRLAGVLNQPDLLKRMVAEGHQLSNHGFTHGAFGPCKYPYWRRRCLADYRAVLSDLENLHELVETMTGVNMQFGRPAHYIDKTRDGKDAYDAYATVGYLYLGASFDGGGWQSSAGSLEEDLRRMISPLSDALAKDPDSLNGQIIFHKDGYNMSSQAPAPHGLRRQLEILESYGYEVVTVSQLLDLSPFTDISRDHPACESALALVQAGFPVVYTDNCIRPDTPLTVGELEKMCSRGTRAPLEVKIRSSYLANFIRGIGTADRSPVALRSLVSACQTFVDSLPVSEEEKRLRGDLVARRGSLSAEEEAKTEVQSTQVTRGCALMLMAAAFLGK